MARADGELQSFSDVVQVRRAELLLRNSAFGRYKTCLEQNNLLKDTKIRVYKPVVLTTLLYGAESLVIYHRHLRLVTS